ncbi:MAG TPA: peptidylprolyl isomerase [Cycloclasticus sp.]|jgi:FKBP-type peptidyl-prolyl cis-trans isomerase SlyD|nr:peptidylprolyl isomerase [Cycloclasticus sp.]HIL93580.1 peptidylprolyl isomerase [Cycloclasticus sp.]
MKITKDAVVRFHYTLKNDEDQIIERSDGKEATAYLQGHGGMIRGVQLALEGKQAGDKFTVTVHPKDGYGERVDDSIQNVPVKHLLGAKKWRPGMIATVYTEKGQRQVSIVKMGKFMAKVDTNHPLAGQTLHFDIDIVDVREATQEEISHGHAHGAGGHHH